MGLASCNQLGFKSNQFSLLPRCGLLTLLFQISDVDLQGLDASIKPVLGDLAIIATGQTAQNVTTNATNYSFQQFSANFKNIFKPEITVKIGEKELNAMIDERIDQKAKEN